MYTKKVKSQLIAAPPTTEVPADASRLAVQAAFEFTVGETVEWRHMRNTPTLRIALLSLGSRLASLREGGRAGVVLSGAPAGSCWRA